MTSFKTGEKVTRQVLFSKYIEEKRKEDEKKFKTIHGKYIRFYNKL